MENLKRKIYILENEKLLKSKKFSIDTQTKNSERGDKIRTYNFKQDRITDHRTNDDISNINEYLKGEEKFLLSLWKILLNYEYMFFLQS